MRAMISIDDGSKWDYRIFEMLKEHGLTDIATFYIAPFNQKVSMLSRKEIKEISELCEIGGHTMGHEVLTKLSRDSQVREILEGNAALREITGKNVTVFAPPRGWYNDEVTESVRQCGMKMMRTMKQGAVSMPNQLPFVLPITVHMHPFHIKDWKNLLEDAKQKMDGYFHITMHGWEVEKFGLWEKLNEIFYAIALSRN